MRNDERAADIVRFWRAIEMFSPQSVPRPADGEQNGHGRVLSLAPDELAPWQPGHPLRSRPLKADKTRLFTVYGGLYNVSDARRELERVFGEDAKPADGRSITETAMFAFTVDADGRLVENSATLSTCAWALNRMYAPGPDDPHWLDGFESDERAFVAALNKLSRPQLAAGDGDTGTSGASGTPAGDAGPDARNGAARSSAEAGGTPSISAITGTAVKAAVTGLGSSLAGPIVGGIAGEIVGTFVENLLSHGPSDPASSPPDQRESPRVPRLDLTAVALHEFVNDLAEALGIAEPLRVAGVRVQCSVLPVKSTDKPNQQDFLNSFILEDLSRIEKEVRAGRAGDALAAYLSSGNDIRLANRIDVRTVRSTLVHGVAPRRLPGGRWPTSPDRSLVVSQQFAVNQILGELSSRSGVFAVNGPPGTGKTTMLRDVLANLVVERARQLAELDNPLEAFTDVLDAVSLNSRYTARVRGLRPKLTGFEVVLATANNDAATNVTADIPGIKAVHGAEDDALAADYFTELAGHILGDEAWGLTAAVLGNMSNRSMFADRFWWSNDVGMLAILQRVRDGQEEADDWSAAAARFRQAEQKVRELTLERQHVADAIEEVRYWKAEVPKREAARAASRTEYERRGVELAQRNDRYRQAGNAYAAIDQEYQNHPRHKPGFWVSLSTGFKAGRRWARRHAELAASRDRAGHELDRLLAEMQRAYADLQEAHQQCDRHDQALAQANASASAARGRMDAARARWPGRVPAGDLADEDDETLQLCSPWADEEFCAARTNLFLESLRLHKAFLLNAGASARDNLAVITAVLQRKAEVRPEALLAAWQTFFLVVPMISTTFASLPRLFDGLGRETLGWLFVDEAGQAAPQLTAGGLWRSRRAVIVGDPQQLEPILTLPLPAQHALRRHYQVDEEWTPDGTSAQRVADRLARHGTFLPEANGEGHVWVGAPLRAHRRCDRPMFDISNRVAYGGDLMIYGTPERAASLGETTWIDVRSAQSNGNWVPEEGRALRALLGELSAAGVPGSSIRVISPFRQVVHGSKASVEAEFGWEFARDNVGTVHTVQGQESDVIVLVLGTGPGRAQARSWAAEKPNLLNVAVSRAKRRLYVIGNRANWQDLPSFCVLAQALPIRSHPPS